MARELTPAAALGAYAVGLVLVFLAGLGVGRVAGPVDGAEQSHGDGMHTSTTTEDRDRRHGGADHGMSGEPR